MIQLPRFDNAILDTVGNAISGASVEIRRQGATVKGAQSGTSPFTVNVDDIGAIVASDTVVLDGGTTTYNVDSVSITNQTITISGFAGTLNLTDEQRFSPSNNLPTLYNDSQFNETTTNPITTGSDGLPNTTSKGAWPRNRGFYDYRLSGGTITTPRLVQDFFVVGNYPDFYVSDARYGAKFDGTTDDATAITRCIADAAKTITGDISGATVVLPKGDGLVNSQVLVPNRVRLVGQGVRNTALSMGPSFPASTGLIRWGDASGRSFGSTVEEMRLDCKTVAGSVGIIAAGANEGCLLRQVLIERYVSKGVHFESTANQGEGVVLDSVFLSHNGAASDGIYVERIGSLSMRGLSIGAYDGVTTTTGTGVLLDIPSGFGGGIQADIDMLFAENHSTVLFIGPGARATVGTIRNGTPGITDVIKLDAISSGIHAFGIIQGGATNAVKDNNTGQTFSILANGFYIRTADSAGGSTYVLTSASAATSRMTSAFLFEGLTEFDAATTFDADANFKRLVATRGTALVVGDFSISAGWGTTASMTTVTGRDTRGFFSITSSGTGQAANPTVTLTFKDGAFTNGPRGQVSRADANAPAGGYWRQSAQGTTSITWQFVGTPVAGNAYQLDWLLVD